MNEKSRMPDNIVTFSESFRLIKEGWRLLAATTVIGGIFGICLGYVLPEKFLASGLIRPAQVSGFPVEDIRILVEEMRSPTFFSPGTREACDNKSGEQLAKAINAYVARQSSFISVSYKSRSSQLSSSCLQATLNDVNENQAALMRSKVNGMKDDLRAFKEMIAHYDSKQEIESAAIRGQLEAAKDDLRTYKSVINSLETSVAKISGGEGKIEESILLSTLLQSKKMEVKSLESKIEALEGKLKSLSVFKGDVIVAFQKESPLADQEGRGVAGGGGIEIRTLRARASELERNMQAPATELARFATPIYAPVRAVEPKRRMIVAITLLLGGLSGLILLFARRFLMNAQREI